jgi:hypothetical protein
VRRRHRTRILPFGTDRGCIRGIAGFWRDERGAIPRDLSSELLRYRRRVLGTGTRNRINRLGMPFLARPKHQSAAASHVLSLSAPGCAVGHFSASFPCRCFPTTKAVGTNGRFRLFWVIRSRRTTSGNRILGAPWGLTHGYPRRRDFGASRRGADDTAAVGQANRRQYRGCSAASHEVGLKRLGNFP